MKRINLLIPILGLAAFAGYFAYWKDQQPVRIESSAAAVDPYADRSGRKEAEAELAAGKLVLIESAPPVSWDRERREIALAKYNLELREREGDVSTEAFAKYADAFNRVMRPKVIARHGRGVFDAIHREAIALWEARRSGASPVQPTSPPAGREP